MQNMPTNTALSPLFSVSTLVVITTTRLQAEKKPCGQFQYYFEAYILLVH